MCEVVEPQSLGPPDGRQIGKDGPPITSLTSLRGLAASWIVLYHFQSDIYRLFPKSIALEPFLSQGHLAVACFFILSGFVLFYNYASTFEVLQWKAYGKFLMLRLARIYPVHLFTLLVVLGMVLVSRASRIVIDSQGYSETDFIFNLALVQTWVPHFRLNWNYPAWSISSEWFAYLWFPSVCAAWNKVAGRRKSFWLALGAFAFMQSHAAFSASLPFKELLSVVGPFLTGCALCLVLQSRKIVLRRWRWVPELCCALWLIAPFFLKGRMLLFLMLTLFSLLIFSLGVLRESCAWLLRSTALVFVGEISYSLYMTHTLVQKVMNEWGPATTASATNQSLRIWVLLVYVLLILSVALGTYFLVERPARVWLRRGTQNRPSDAEPAVISPFS